MATLRLYKSEKLCSQTAIDMLFSRRQPKSYTTDSADAATMATSALDVNPGGTIAFPLRAVWRYNHGRNNGAKVQFLITIPKKRIRHAVDRVTARRRVREAYRLNRHLLDTLPSDIKIDIAFIYVAPTLQPYATIEAAVCKLLRRMTRNYSNTATTPDTNATHNS